MKKWMTGVLAVLCLWQSSPAQTTVNAVDSRTFVLTPTAPPEPAMKYQLLYENLVDRQPGDAAVLYMDAVLLMGPDVADKADKALAAFDAKDMASFDSLADSLNRPTMFDELDLAARRQDCDWQCPFRTVGGRTLLPHLWLFRHGLAKLVEIRALRQIERNQVDDALATLRLGYELSDKVGHEPTLVSGLVSISIAGIMDDALAQLMNNPDSPNLYWALTDFPGRKQIVREVFEGGRLGSVSTIPTIARVMAGEELSADQWRAAFKSIGDAIALGQPTTQHPILPNPFADISADTLQQARSQYAQSHHLTIEQAAGIEPEIIIGNFYFRQYVTVYDDMYKLLGLPYPALLAKSAQFDAEAASMRAQHPGNLFLQALLTVRRGIWGFARVDRELAALTAVEAIRSYAAANDGKLPARLDDILDTPAPENPATGKPFDYSVQNDTATLSDPQSSESPLTYTIRIRK